MSTLQDKEHFPAFNNSWLCHPYRGDPQWIWKVFAQFFTELYSIGIGRILEIGSAVTGNQKVTIGRGHYLSILVWLLIIAGIAGYFSGIYVRDFWSFLLILTAGATLIYAHWKALHTLTSAYPDGNQS